VPYSFDGRHEIAVTRVPPSVRCGSSNFLKIQLIGFWICVSSLGGLLLFSTVHTRAQLRCNVCRDLPPYETMGNRGSRVGMKWPGGENLTGTL